MKTKATILILPTVLAALGAIPLLQNTDLEPVVSVLKELPALGLVVWVVFWLQGRHQDTIQKIMTAMVEREESKDQTQREIITALLRTIEKPSD